MKKKHDAGKFCFLGEHIVTGESYEEAIKRGVKEETGTKADSFKFCASNIFEYQKEKELVKFYLVEWNGNELIFGEEEVEKYCWVELADLISENYDFSDMTIYWIEKISWKNVFTN